VSTDEGKAENERFGTIFTPIYILTDTGGEILDFWIGYDGAEAFLARLATARADLATLAEREARLETDPRVRDAMVLGDHGRGTRQWSRSAGFYRRALAIDPDEAKAARAPIQVFKSTLYAVGDGEAQPTDVIAAADAVVNAADADPSDVLEVAERMMRGAAQLAQPQLATPYVVKAVAATEGAEDERLQERRAALLPLKVLYADGDPERAFALKQETLPEGWQQDSNQLNGLAWWCFQNNVALAEAEVHARKAVALATEDDRKANCLDTLAEVVCARGDPAGAVALMKEAVALSDREYFREQLKKFGERAAGDS
jgi:hypothetical protein